MHELSSSIYANNFDLIALSETWFSSDIFDSEILNSSYTLYRKDRDLGRTNVSRGGGVLIGVSSKYQSYQLDFNDIHDKIPFVDIVGVKITIGKAFHFVINLYIPPNISGISYDLLFKGLCNLPYLINNNVNLTIIGDFNIKDLVLHNSNDYSGTGSVAVTAMKNFMSFLNVNQMNSILNHNGRILDAVLSNSVALVSESPDPLLIVDPHHPALEILIDYKQTPYKFPEKYHTSYNFRKANFNRLYNDLLNTNWSFLDTVSDADVACNLLYSKLNSLFTDSVLKKRKRSNSAYPVWFTRNIIRDIEKKNICHRRFKLTGSAHAYEEYKIIRTRLKKSITSARQVFTNRAEQELCNNPASFWSFINSFKNESGLPTSMTLGKSNLNNPQDIVNGFANYFQQSYIHSSVRDPSKWNTDNNVSSISVPAVNEDLVLQALKTFKNNTTCGPDEIPSFLLRDCATIFAKPLTMLFNLILKTQSFPNIWKQTKIVPVFKSGDKCDITNYRPIALLCNFSKLFERIICNFLSFHTRPLISEHQHGFMRGRSTTTNLVCVTQFIANSLDQLGQVDVIYTDFSKAFDRLDHGLLLNKLSCFGLNDNLLFLLSSYLSNRRLFVEYRGFKSTEYPATSGVPQGSILGPLLFILFINDINTKLSSRLLLYADDCKLFGNVNCLQDCLSLQNDLCELKKWCDGNALPLNVSKCKYMSFHKKRNPFEFMYAIDATPLTKCTTFKDLGVIFDPKLSFSCHINTVATESYRQLGFLIRNTKNFTDIKSLKALYNAFVRSKLEYACVVWCPGYESYSAVLERVQRRFLKYLHFKTNGVYPERGISQIQLLSNFDYHLLSSRREFVSVVFLYKILNNQIDSPSLLTEIYINIPVVHTRNQNCIHLPVPRSNSLVFSPIFRMCSCYIRIQNSIDIFCCNISRIFNAICYI